MTQLNQNPALQILSASEITAVSGGEAGNGSGIYSVRENEGGTGWKKYNIRENEGGTGRY